MTHIAFSSVRVMRTLGMLGEVAGMAAAIGVRHNCSCREVYQRFLEELKTLMRGESGSKKVLNKHDAFHFMRPVGTMGNETEDCWIDESYSGWYNEYYTIDGKPVFMIYDLYNFVNGLGGIEKASDALNYWRELAHNRGLPGVHFQAVAFGIGVENVSGVDGGIKLSYDDIEAIGFDSITHYQFVHFTNMNRDYLEILEDVKKEWKIIETHCKLPYYPHVSIGWDNNPRYNKYLNNVTKNNTPENFEKGLQMAKAYADSHDQPPLITINSWNEWTETSYLEPDDLNGYGYLEAIKKVFG